jgi:hypothetical protein
MRSGSAKVRVRHAFHTKLVHRGVHGSADRAARRMPASAHLNLSAIATSAIRQRAHRGARTDKRDCSALGARRHRRLLFLWLGRLFLLSLLFLPGLTLVVVTFGQSAL